MGKRLAH
jgi:DNA repair protein RAD57